MIVASGIPPVRAALLILIAAGAAYANSVANDFAYDDNTIKDYLPKEKEYNRSVVPSPASKLVSTIFDRVHF